MGKKKKDHPNVTVVTSREEFEREAQRLRESGFTEVPGALGGGSGGGDRARKEHRHQAHRQTQNCSYSILHSSFLILLLI